MCSGLFCSGTAPLTAGTAGGGVSRPLLLRQGDLEGPAVEASAAFRVRAAAPEGAVFPVDREAAASPVVPAAAASPPALSVEVASVAPGAEDFLVAAVEALAEAEAAGSAVDRKIGACPWGWTRPFCRPLGNGLGHTWRLGFIYIRGTNDSGE